MWTPDPASIITAEAKAMAASATAWADLRAERDRRLADCDYTQLPDAPEADKAAWATYRQALRELPETTTNPEAPVWPVPPGEQGRSAIHRFSGRSTAALTTT